MAYKVLQYVCILLRAIIWCGNILTRKFVRTAHDKLVSNLVEADNAEEMVAKAWELALRRKSIDRDTDFQQMRMSTNRALEIIQEIWWSTGIDVPVNAFYGAPTIRRMAAGIRDGSALIAPDLIRMRDGDDSMPLFLFPGGGGVLFELNHLVTALDWPGTIYGIAFSGLDGIGPFHDRFEQEAARSLAIIRSVQRTGPYRLAGYSIGGVTALETARLIRQQGEDRIFLGLLDTPLNDHSWPLRVWASLILRKVAARLRKPQFHRSATAASSKRDIQPRRRGTQLEFRFRNPANPDYPYYSPYWVSYHTPNYTRVAANACRMKGFYTPRRYDGPVFFFASTRGDIATCDPQAVWPKYLERVEWIRLSGDHLSILLGRNAVRLAAEIIERMKRYHDAP
jgi:thioesterase domain-containing protein